MTKYAKNEETGELYQLIGKEWKPLQMKTEGDQRLYLMGDGKWEPDPTEGAQPMLGPKMSTALQGTTFGFGDEAMADVAASNVQARELKEEHRRNPDSWLRTPPGRDLLSVDESPNVTKAREDQLRAERRQLKDYSEENPLASMGLEAAGALPTLLVPGIGHLRLPAITGLSKVPGISKISNAFSRVAPNVSRKLKTASELGAGAGAVYGAGTAEGDLLDRAGGAAEGAIQGAVAAPVLTSIGLSGMKALRGALTAMGMRNADTLADVKILQAIEQAGLNPREVAQKLVAAQSRGIKPEAIFDMPGMEPLRDLARTAYRRSPLARKQGSDLLLGRTKEGQVGSRVMDDVHNMVAPSSDAFNVGKKITSSMKAKAKPFYDMVNEAGPIWNEDLNKLFERPAIQTAYKNLLENAANRGDDVAPIFDAEGKVINPPTLKMWDLMKQEIATLVNEHREPLTGRLNLAGNKKAQSLNDLLKQVDDAILKADNSPEVEPGVTALQKGRSIWRDDMSALDALRTGQQSLSKMRPEEVGDYLAKLSESEKNMFKIGVADEIRRRIEGKRDTHDMVGWIVDTESVRKTLQKVFDGEGEFESLVEALRREQSMHASKNRIMGNSVTSEVLVDMADMGSTPKVIADSLRGGWKSALLNQIMEKSGAAADALTGRTAERVGSRLFEADPAKNLLTLGRLHNVTMPRTAKTKLLEDASVIRPLSFTGGALSGIDNND